MNIRKIRKWIAYLLLIGAIALAIPAGFSPDDLFTNIPVASWLNNTFGFSLASSLLFSYTLIPILFFLASVVVYPAKNNYVAKKFLEILKEKFKQILKKAKKNPIIWIFIVIMIIVTYKLLEIYQKYIMRFH